MRRSKFGLVQQLLAGFSAGALLVGGLLFAGDRMLDATSVRLQQTLSGHVRPLAQLHKLQSSISALRHGELELPQTTDAFLIPTRTARMRALIAAADDNIHQIASQIKPQAPIEADRLLGHWQAYRISLEAQIGLAESMNLTALGELSLGGASTRHATIQDVVSEIATSTQTAAEKAYTDALDEQARQRGIFMLFALLGSLTFIVGLAWSGRTVVHRIGLLNQGAKQLAIGIGGQQIDPGGNDEITELGNAFNTMRDKVLSREMQLREAQQQLEQRVEERTRDLSESNLRLTVAASAFQTSAGMTITNADKVILQVNQSFTDITGYSAEEAVGQTPRLMASGRHDAAFYRAMWDTITRTGSWQGEIWNRRKSGEIYPEWLTISAVHGDHGGVAHYVGTFTDITLRKQAEEEIHLLAYYDSLTQLPNRRLFHDRLSHALINSVRHRRQGALMLIDMDNFKNLNDSLGHDVGDQFLIEVATRLTGSVREGDTVARLGGDEFVVILEELNEGPLVATQIESICTKIQEVLGQPYQLSLAIGSADAANRQHHCSASIGIAVFGNQSLSASELMKRADTAMYQAKALGRNTACFFDQSMQVAVTLRAALDADLRQALQSRQFLLHYQPQMDAHGRLSGSEALVRWQHPTRGLVPPNDFIPLSEENGLILPLGQWVLESACEQLAAWALWPEMASHTLAVNVSARQLRQVDFVAQVMATLARTGAPAQQLKLEITESLLLQDIEDTIAKMLALKKAGIGFSLDDFGTGYSSLSYLTRLPLDQLKIDRSFVSKLESDDNSMVICAATISLAHSLRLKVVAEGVETEAERYLLTAVHSCDYLQGYLFSKPLPLEQFEAFARSNLQHQAQADRHQRLDPDDLINQR
jgi:diguanylate cyclase (GGDEF)-like protein/PAS domain S-box-containing protein